MMDSRAGFVYRTGLRAPLRRRLDPPAMIPALSEALAERGFDTLTDKLLGAYSKGMRRKVVITAGLLHNPPVVFFDESLDGLDANAAVGFKTLIQTLAREGKTIGVTCVFSREAVRMPAAPETSCDASPASDGTLNCHGYGSAVAVTATFGMSAAGWVLKKIASSC